MGIPPSLARLEQGHAHQEHRDQFHDDQAHRNALFPYRVLWEVVVVHKAFLVLRIQTINDLRFTHWCQGQDRKGLAFVHE